MVNDEHINSLTDVGSWAQHLWKSGEKLTRTPKWIGTLGSVYEARCGPFPPELERDSC